MANCLENMRFVQEQRDMYHFFQLFQRRSFFSRTRAGRTAMNIGSLQVPFVVAAILLALINSPVVAQTGRAATAASSTQKTNVLSELQRKFKKQLSTKRSVMIGGQQQLDANTVAELTTWYKALLRAMVESQEDISPLREEVLNDLRIARMAEFRDFLRDFLLQWGRYLIAHASVNTAAKFNLMLIIGELNESEGQLTAPPVPLQAARQLLLESLADPKQAIAIKVAALVGLKRHVELEMLHGGQRLANDRQSGQVPIVQLLMKVLEAAPPSEDAAPGHYWTQRQALEILALMGTAGPNGQIALAVDRIAGNQDAPLWLRCSAVEALGKLAIPAQTPLNADATVKQIAMLAVDVLQAEVGRLQAWEQEQQIEAERLGGAGSYRRPASASALHAQESGRDKAGQEEKPKGPGYKVVLATRRQLKHRLACIRTGLGERQGNNMGVRALATSSQSQGLINQMDAELKAVSDMVDQSEIDPSQLREAIEQSAKRLASNLTPGSADAAPAGDRQTPATDKKEKSLNDVFAK